jgi:hypothetical protein
MMKESKKMRLSMWCAVMATALCVVPAANAFTLSVVPQSPSVSLGGTLTVDVVAAGLLDGSAPSIGTYDLSLSYDSALLSLADVTFGSGLDVNGLGSMQDTSASTPGVANAFELSFDSIADLNQLQPGTFSLFTLVFHAGAIGTSALTLAINALGDAAGNALTPDVANATVSVAPVPLPAAAWLLLSGIAATSGFVRRRRSAQ